MFPDYHYISIILYYIVLAVQTNNTKIKRNEPKNHESKSVLTGEGILKHIFICRLKPPKSAQVSSQSNA